MGQLVSIIILFSALMAWVPSVGWTQVPIPMNQGINRGQSLPIHAQGPICANSQVKTIVQNATTIFIGGNFTQVGPCHGSIVAISLSDHKVMRRSDGTFPGIMGAGVDMAVSDGAEGVYIVGKFSAIQGYERAGIAHLNSDLELDLAFNPIVTGGDEKIYAVLYDGSLVYILGNFKYVNGERRYNIAALDPISGAVLPWSPRIEADNWVLKKNGNTVYVGGWFRGAKDFVEGSTAEIDMATGLPTLGLPDTDYGYPNTIISDGNGGWFVGGYFDTVNGQPTSNLIHILADGSLDSFAPEFDDGIYALVLDGTTLYVGGYFNTVNGVTRNGVAAFDLTTGSLTSFDPNVEGVETLALEGTTLYIGGFFTKVNGSVTRNRLAAVNTSTGIVTSFNPNISGGPYPVVTKLLASGGVLYAAGGFTTVGGSTTRNGVAAFNTTTGALTSFNPNLGTNGDGYALAIDGSTLYVGGWFDTVNGSTSRSNLAAFDISTGTATAFDPSLDGGVVDLAVVSGVVYAGGEFYSVDSGAVERWQLAAFDGTTGAVTSWFPQVEEYEDVTAMGASSTKIFAGGYFSRVYGATERIGIAAIDATTGEITDFDAGLVDRWNDYVNDIAFDGSTVYVAGYFFDVNENVPRSYLAAFDEGTGAVMSFNPDVGDCDVNSIAISGSLVYAGGCFTKVNGSVTRNYMAAFDKTTGVATSFDPNFDDYVWSLILDGTYIYAAGGFTSANGGIPRNHIAVFDMAGVDTGIIINNSLGAYQAPGLVPMGDKLIAYGNFKTFSGGANRNKFAAIDTATGHVTSFDPQITGSTVMSLALDGSTLYIGGLFSKIGTTSRSNLGAVDIETGAVTAFNPNLTSGAVATLLVDGSTVYIGGNFYKVNGNVTRYGLAAVNASTGTLTAFNANMPMNSSIQQMAIGGGVLYFVGSFSKVNGSVSRSGLAAVDAATGVVTSFNPDPRNSKTTWPVFSGLLLDGSTLYIAGQFDSLNGGTVLRNGIGAVDISTGTATAFDPNPGAGGVSLIRKGPSGLFIGGNFSTLNGGTPRSLLAEVDPVTGTVMAFDANLSDGYLESLAVTSSGGLIIGGYFEAGTANVRSNFCQMDGTTGVCR